MSHTFMLCTRATRGGQFIPEPGTSRYLKIPKGQTPRPDHAIPRNQWVRELLAAATWGTDARRNNAPRGDILVYIHGYNNDLATITSRHERLETDLAAQGFKGVILTFCWPSDDKPIAYLEDRHDAKTCAMQLVTDGIALLSRHQSADCSINIHLLAHSTGAYVVREAFDDADDSILANGGWSVSPRELAASAFQTTLPPKPSMSTAQTTSNYSKATRKPPPRINPHASVPSIIRGTSGTALSPEISFIPSSETWTATSSQPAPETETALLCSHALPHSPAAGVRPAASPAWGERAFMGAAL